VLIEVTATAIAGDRRDRAPPALIREPSTWLAPVRSFDSIEDAYGS
jgi:hypothetical protein